MLKKLLLISIFSICSSLLYSQTVKNSLEAVTKAYSNEINSSFVYSKFAKVSTNKSVVNLFNTVSDSKSCHATILYNTAVQERLTSTVLKSRVNEPKIGTDIENLKSAVLMTSYGYTKMYPELLKAVNKDKQKQMAEIMNRIVKAEKSNNALFTKAMNNLQNNKPLAEKYYLCETCGYVEANSIPDKCPICGKSRNAFKEYK